MTTLENGGDPADDAALLESVMSAAPQDDAETGITTPEPEQAEAPKAEADADPAPAAPVVPDATPNRVPLKELLEERKARQALERQIAEMNGRFAAFEGMMRQPQQQAPQQPVQAPDYLEDPAGFVRHQVQADFERQQAALMYNARMAAEARYGDAEISAAVKAFDEAHAYGTMHPVEYQRVMGSPNPFAEALKWHRQQTVLSETGGDLKAYRQKTEAELLGDPEFRKRAMAAWQSQASGPTAPRTVVSLPSISKVGAAALPSGDGAETDAQLLEKVMSRPRTSDGRFR